MSVVEILSPLESKISLTIGNLEIVNMFVRTRVHQFKAAIESLEAEYDEINARYLALALKWRGIG